ncbi:acyl-CoA/acyl-ACP dehydrogenase [Alicycliphilus denitrificans]|uniref:Acyl-CoA/acyl-ACP dehydrogenase n=1 Tax=Alicycliphilus denitrificans TaxID=179636 RepID=A0A858ZWQ3_9BURK|nr:acyl-CoA dehydrogenase family protein [Alicycliphilus denitrificans]ADV01014.1 acyl-CoA dehydrogenase domain-containing protein [Alicycliphilus denitrificans BC]QKD45167.1 acyl-CoA/acyl-ACP dehydrogenase [Alicycliphilus denitrificans]GAO24609.1 acyl-CoA dehydrogenase [Alicycliphilus sp. B1]
MQENNLSEAQQQIEMLRESAADFVGRNTDMKRLRERRGILPGYEPEHLRHMAELGWLGIVVPEAHGGLGLGFCELAVVLQELGKGLMADPLVPVAFAARVLQHGDNEGLKQSLLPQVVDASLLPCVAWQEGLGGIETAAIETRVEADGADLLLSGRKRFVAGAAGAGGFVVSARGAAGCGLYWVDAQAAGLTVGHEQRADETPSGVLEFDRVRITPANVVSAAGPQGLAALDRALDEAAVLAGAEMLGVVEAALHMALGYMRTRVQFGKPIGSFQALQHKAADLYVQQELVRAVLAEAVRVLDADTPAQERASMASRFKARASDGGLRVTREVIQLHGAIGFTDEYDAGLYLKRALVLSAWLGNASAHRRRFAALQQEVTV